MSIYTTTLNFPNAYNSSRWISINGATEIQLGYVCKQGIILFP